MVATLRYEKKALEMPRVLMDLVAGGRDLNSKEAIL
jgi:hypothetical protein